MKIKDLIKQLAHIENDIGGNFDIISIHNANGFIQMEFSNGAITHIMEPRINNAWNTAMDMNRTLENDSDKTLSFEYDGVKLNYKANEK